MEEMHDSVIPHPKEILQCGFMEDLYFCYLQKPHVVVVWHDSIVRAVQGHGEIVGGRVGTTCVAVMPPRYN